jgi:hypothetical protein
VAFRIAQTIRVLGGSSLEPPESARQTENLSPRPVPETAPSTWSSRSRPAPTRTPYQESARGRAFP